MLLVKEGIPHNGKGCEQDVVELVKPLLIEGLASKGRGEAISELGKHEDDVLVEDITNKEGIATIGFTAVSEQKVLQELKLTDCIVG